MTWDFLLPLLTYPDATPGGAITRALDFAATVGGGVTTLAHQVDIPPVANAVGALLIDYPAMVAEAEARSEKTGKSLLQQVSTAASRLSLQVWEESFTCRLESVGDLLAAAARTHDCTLMPIDCGSREQVGAAETVLFHSGGPIVFFGQNEAPAHLEVVVLAWDGQRAASRVVRDALPILGNARRVVVLTASDDKPIADAGIAAAVSFLSHHGIVARHEQFARSSRSIGDALQEEAIARDAGLLIMGGYGHNRTREFVLGGATRDVLSDVRLPIFMSH